MTDYLIIDKCLITGNKEKIVYFDLELMPLINK